MTLKVLSSGSSGNCYLLESDTECLVIEAGLPFMKVKKALNFNIRKIVGVIVTHCHKDHAGYISEYEKTGIQVYRAYDIEEWNDEKMKYYSVGMGNFKFKPFPLVHDVPCYGFWIHHPEMGKMVYVTDTEYCPKRFKDLHHILVEANYSEEFINNDAINRNHVLQGHMSLKTALDFISVNDSPELRNVILLHLSGENANAELFRQQATKVTNKQVYIAEEGLEVDLNLCPF